MTLYFHDDGSGPKLLFVKRSGGRLLVAKSEACCCGVDCASLPDTLNVDLSAGGVCACMDGVTGTAVRINDTQWEIEICDDPWPCDPDGIGPIGWLLTCEFDIDGSWVLGSTATACGEATCNSGDAASYSPDAGYTNSPLNLTFSDVFLGDCCDAMDPSGVVDVTITE